MKKTAKQKEIEANAIVFNSIMSIMELLDTQAKEYGPLNELLIGPYRAHAKTGLYIILEAWFQAVKHNENIRDNLADFGRNLSKLEERRLLKQAQEVETKIKDIIKKHQYTVVDLNNLRVRGWDEKKEEENVE